MASSFFKLSYRWLVVLLILASLTLPLLVKENDGDTATLEPHNSPSEWQLLSGPAHDEGGGG
ncbi:MAG: hypothetical protein AAF702_39450 [Chloroflexota bacterium]